MILKRCEFACESDGIARNEVVGRSLWRAVELFPDDGGVVISRGVE